MIFDSHAHYDDEAFDADREELLAQCQAQGIEYIVNVSASLASVKTTLELAWKHPFIYAAVGVHPDEVGELTAKELELPVIVHSREACADTLEEIKRAHTERLRGVIHCFSYSQETAREYLSMGYYIGIGGVATFKNAKKLKEVVKMLPLERMLLETDCPYLAPVPYRGKRNSSLNLPYVAQAVAELKGVEAEEVIRITNENARKLYFRGRDL